MILQFSQVSFAKTQWYKNSDQLVMHHQIIGTQDENKRHAHFSQNVFLLIYFLHHLHYTCIMLYHNDGQLRRRLNSIAIILELCLFPIKSLAPGDAIWHNTESKLAQVMAWCHQAPSHNRIQCWLQINKALQNTTKCNVKGLSIWIMYLKNIFLTSPPSGQWVNPSLPSISLS